MTNDCVAQSWYRFVRIIGSPIALCCPQVISHTPAFMQFILLRDDSIEPHQHPCLQILPQIFLKAMKGIACEVDAFLGENFLFPTHMLKILVFTSYICNIQSILSCSTCIPEGIFQPIKWEEGVIIDNTISTINNQSNPSGVSQRSGSGLSRETRGAETNSSSSTSSNSNSVIGVGSRNIVVTSSCDANILSEQSSPTQPLQRRLAKSFSVAPSHSHTKGCDNNSII